jgi:uncharacterized protein
MFLNPELTFAAYHGETEKVLDFLGDSKDFSNSRDAEIALGFAANGGQLETVQALIELGTSIEKNWVALLNAAASGGNIELVMFLVEHMKDIDEWVPEWLPGRVFWNGTNSLMSAAAGSHPQMIKFLLNQGADVNNVNTKGKTALFFAAGAGTREAVHILLAHGAFINHQDEKGNTPLLYSVEKVNSETVKELLERGADTAFFNVDDISPLRMAFKREWLKAAERLLASRASMDERDSQGLTTRDWLSEHGSKRVIQWMNKLI